MCPRSLGAWYEFMNPTAKVTLLLQDSLSGRPISHVLLKNANGDTLSVVPKPKLINQMQLIKREIEFEYLGSELSLLGKLKQLIKVAFTVNGGSFFHFFRNNFLAYVIEVPHSFMLNSPVKLMSSNYSRLWISRSATLAGIQPVGYSRIYEYDFLRERYLDRLLVWGHNRQHSPDLQDILSNPFLSILNLKSIDFSEEDRWIQKNLVNVEIIGGNVLISDDVFIPTNHRVPKGDSSWPSDYPTFFRGSLFMPRPRMAINIPVAMFAGHSHSWFHFIVEFVPALNRIPFDLRDTPIVIPEGSPKQILDLYRLLGFKEVIALKPWECAKVSNLSVTLDLRQIPFTDFSSNGMDLLGTQRILAKLCPQRDSSALSRKIYLKRDSNLLRGLVNQSEIDHYLEDQGFDLVYPGRLSLMEQISLMSEASTIVAESGAALTSLIFATHELRVIELQPYSRNIEDLWMNFSTTLGHNFSKVHGKRHGIGEYLIDSKFRIELSELDELLHQ